VFGLKIFAAKFFLSLFPRIFLNMSETHQKEKNFQPRKLISHEVHEEAFNQLFTF
jgi:hypothetical protein